MKTSIITVFIFSLFTGFCVANVADEGEKDAIKKVITEATDAFRARDLNKLKEAFVNDETLVKTGARITGYGVDHGWDNVEKRYKNMFKNQPAPRSGTYEKINFKIKVYKDSAWAIHDEILKNEEGDTFKQVISHFLEKHNGKWKIVYMANIGAGSWDNAE